MRVCSFSLIFLLVACGGSKTDVPALSSQPQPAPPLTIAGSWSGTVALTETGSVTAPVSFLLSETGEVVLGTGTIGPIDRGSVYSLTIAGTYIAATNALSLAATVQGQQQAITVKGQLIGDKLTGVFDGHSTPFGFINAPFTLTKQ